MEQKNNEIEECKEIIFDLIRNTDNAKLLKYWMMFIKDTSKMWT